MQILIVDDEPQIRSSLEGLLRDEGYEVVSVESGEKGLRAIDEKRFEIVILDVLLPGMSGISVLEEIRRRYPWIRVFMISGKADIATAVKAIRLGAYDFFEKPINPERILLSLKNLSEYMALERRVESLSTLIERDYEIIGNSPAMRDLKVSISKAAPSEGRVLIFGENGTGKELVARAIHLGSSRKDRSFITLNCAAIPQSLIESELFGYERGAFTGAIKRKAGRFELADGGTLFLDEIGDLSLESQAKLLRVLEENEAMRVGGERPYKFDVRIISATNKNLKREIDEGRFREDLYYRLNVIPIEVPPLRERKSDIPELAEYFLSRICMRSGKGMKYWGDGAKEVLSLYEWPGNVRELRNFVERLIIMSNSEVITEEEVRRMIPESSNIVRKDEEIFSEEGFSFREIVQRFEKELLSREYDSVGRNVSKLARKLKMDRANLHRKLKSYGIK